MTNEVDIYIARVHSPTFPFFAAGRLVLRKRGRSKPLSIIAYDNQLAFNRDISKL